MAMALAILSAISTLLSGILLICMMQTTFRKSDRMFRVGIALVASGLLCMSLGPFWGVFYSTFAQLLLNFGLMVFIAQLRWRQLEMSLPQLRAIFRRWMGSVHD